MATHDVKERSENDKKTQRSPTYDFHAVNTAEVHSDEWFTEDKILANEERNDNIRSGRLISTNSVIKIHNKERRSSRVRKVAKV
ncbi:hypothetical protein RclHR1_40460001 [Rhizophagus clarus]|uniref:Uncharacterized protein n=1 Tax=Rhizophagus clarus TaxID=94130 RepID=A0A2Z6RS37_9GLOM|nr:hypothetical protein RclHR1_40460001 [Rhizophagus clarus]